MKVKIKFANDCRPCRGCGEPWCEDCGAHYSDCGCLGPDEAEDMGYEITEDEKGALWAERFDE